jgi:hypothetical protein
MFHDISILVANLVHDLVEIVVGLAWPIVVLVAIVLLRRQLPSIAQAAARQGFKLSGAGVSLEVNAATALPMPEIAFGQVGQPLPSSTVGGSGSTELERLFQPATPLDYAVIDLGTGHSWLTSRIYLFALMLRRMRSMEEFVFVQTSAAVTGSFLAHVSLERVRWRIAQRQPWLEQAYAQAYSNAWTDPTLSMNITSDLGELDYWPATQVVQRFLAGIQRQKPAGTSNPGWVDVTVPPSIGTVPGQSWEEHADWVDGLMLRDLFKDAPVFEFVVDAPGLPQSQRTEWILHMDTRFVAVVDRAQRFDKLIDRTRLLDSAIPK